MRKKNKIIIIYKLDNQTEEVEIQLIEVPSSIMLIICPQLISSINRCHKLTSSSR